MTDRTPPQSFLQAPLHTFGPEDWIPWYPKVAELLNTDDAAVRAAAVERLAMAVFWAERELPEQAPIATRRQRLVWLTGVIDAASRNHPDVLQSFLDQLKYKGDDPVFAPELVAWLRNLRELELPERLLERVEGIAILIGGLEPWGQPFLPQVLDHPSNYVRACAACLLGRSGHGWNEDDNRIDNGFLDALTAMELARPGIAGPWLSGTDLMNGGLDKVSFDVVGWMLDIIERRNGPEPEGLPFNGIDFYIHEMAAGNAEAVRQIIAADHLDLAVMTATEIASRLDAMIPVLCDLSNHQDPRVALPAQIHLAHYHAILHPLADPERIRSLNTLRDDARAFVIRYGQPNRFSEQLVIFPKGDAPFTDDEVASLIDQVLPPKLRGELTRHPLAPSESAPEPYRFGAREIRSYVTGVSLDLIGALDQPGWQRIDISAGRLGAQWDPWNW
jgi:hypothetical protein